MHLSCRTRHTQALHKHTLPSLTISFAHELWPSLLSAGEIACGDAAVFNWLFQPLETKTYSVALPLVLGDAAPQPLLIHGRGYHPLQQAVQAAPSAEEAEQ